MGSKANLQLQTILNSYITQSSLVYNKSDDFFYVVGNTTKNLSKVYTTNPHEVQKKVNLFIQQKSAQLDPDISNSFREQLIHRISWINYKTTGLLAFFHFLFNPQSKRLLLQYREELITLKTSIDKSIEAVKKTPKSSSIPSSSAPSDPVNSGLMKDKPATPGQSTIPQTGSSQTTQAVGPPPPPPLPPGLLTKRPSATNTTTTTLTTTTTTTSTTTATTRANVSKGGGANIPKPRSKPVVSLLMPGEQEPLPFEINNYQIKSQNSSEEAIKAHEKTIEYQIEQIDGYVKALTSSLDLFKNKIEKFDNLRAAINVLQEDFDEHVKKLNQCKSNLKRLEEGRENNKVVFLYYRDGTTFYRVPYYPDAIYESMEKSRLEAKKSLGNIPIDDDEKKDEKKDVGEKTGNIRKNIQSIQRSFSGLMVSREDLRKYNQAHKEPPPSPGTPNTSGEIPQVKDKDQISPCLKISEAIKILTQLIEQYEASKKEQESHLKNQNEAFKKLGDKKLHEMSKLKEKIPETTLPNVCQTLSELAAIYKDKIQLKSTWESAKNSRNGYLKSKDKQSKPVIESHKAKIDTEIKKKVPEYVHITTLHMLISKELKNNFKNLQPSVANYDDTLWSLLISEPPPGSKISEGGPTLKA